jgi:hypothetical protein
MFTFDVIIDFTLEVVEFLSYHKVAVFTRSKHGDLVKAAICSVAFYSVLMSEGRILNVFV